MSDVSVACVVVVLALLTAGLTRVLDDVLARRGGR